MKIASKILPLKHWLVAIFAVYVTIAPTGCRNNDEISGETDISQKDFIVGALLPLSGSQWNVMGITTKAALELARNDINSFLDASGSDVSVYLIIDDTQMDSARNAERFQFMDFRDAKVVFGPLTSPEINSIKPLIDAYSTLIVTQGSTSSQLSSDDKILRFVPTDKLEGKATAVLMKSDSIRAIVPLFRGDIDHSGLYESTKETFVSLGGSVALPVSYVPGQTLFSTSIQTLRSRVGPLISQYGSSRVAIYYSSYDDCVSFFNQIRQDTVLSSVRWYGGHGTVQSDTVIKNLDIADYTLKRLFTCAALSTDYYVTDRWWSVVQQIKSATGKSPSAAALAAYDALWIVTQGYLATDGTTDPLVLKSAILEMSKKYYGATGWAVLNAVGDRQYGKFDFWTVAKSGSNFYWKKTSMFDDATGLITRYQ